MQILVLGMHRSGTSAVTRLLNMLGCHLGSPQSLKGANPENPKGFWENDDIVNVNKDILQAMQCRWDRVANFDAQLPLTSPDFEKLRKRMYGEILKLDAFRPWAIKDPRLCLLSSLWRTKMEVPVCVISVRPPLEIAKSLFTRNNIPISCGIALWEKYTLESLKGSHGLPRILVNYHELLADPVGQTRILGERLTDVGVRRLECPADAEILAFISKDLHRERGTEDLQEQYINVAQRRLYEGVKDGSLLEVPPEELPDLSEGAARALQMYETLIDLEYEFSNSSERMLQLAYEDPAALVERVKAMKSELFGVQEDAGNLSESLKKKKERFTALQQELDKATEEIKRLNEIAVRIPVLAEELAATEKQAAHLNTIAARVPELETALAESKRNAGALDERKAQLEKALKETRDKAATDLAATRKRFESDLAAARKDIQYLYGCVKRLAENTASWNRNWWWRIGLTVRRMIGMLRLKPRKLRMPADIAAEVWRDVRVKYEPKPKAAAPAAGTSPAEVRELHSVVCLLDEWLEALRRDMDNLQRLAWFRLGYLLRKLSWKTGLRPAHPWDPVEERRRLADDLAVWRATVLQRQARNLEPRALRAEQAGDVRRLMRWIETSHRAVERVGNHAWWRFGRKLATALRVGMGKLNAPVISADATMARYRQWRKQFTLDVPSAPASGAATPAGAGHAHLPAVGVAAQTPAKSVDIVVCVHNALDDVRRCLHSVVGNTPAGIYRLLIVNDGSNAECTLWLRKFACRHQAILLESETAQRYTKAANRGLRASDADYVVLLNSDTIVPYGWLAPLVECGESDPAIGIVSPLSNAASYQSVPEVRDETGDWAINALPGEFTVDDMAHAVARLSGRVFPRVPFLNGFCYAIKRAVIEKIGYLDEETFPNGYAEENDYSLRAAGAGFQLAIADNAYVYHAKSKSYSHDMRRTLSSQGYAALNQKHGEAVVADNIRKQADDQSLEPLRARLRDHLATPEKRAALRAPKRLRILFLLLDQARGGGGSNSIVQESVALRELGVETEIAVQAAYRDLNLSLYPNQPRDLFYFYDHEQELRAHAARFDIAIATHFKTMAALQRICAAAPSVVPAYYCQDYEPLFVPEDRPDLLEIARASYTAHPCLTRFAKTDWIRETIGEHHHVPVAKVAPSLDTSIYFPPAHKPRILGKIHVVAMVRMSPNRAPRETMELLGAIQRRYPDRIRVTIFGNDPQSAEFAKMPRDFEFENRGVLIREEVAALLKSADIFVDMSKFQGFGRTGLEAMAVGCATLLPMKGGVHEYARDRENALIVDTEDMEACLAALDELARDEALRGRLAQAGIMTATRYNARSAAVSELLVLQEALRAHLTTIVVPIYNAREEVRACVDSILACTTRPYRLLLIDDCSPDEGIWPMLQEYALAHPQVTAMRNAENRGYTQTINIGCSLAPGDVVLLNSDTRVTPGWLDRLADAARSREDVATVTPLSNAAGAWSVPERNVEKPLPDGITLERMAELVETLSPRLRPEIPTGNGFCMYITRRALERVGLFDAVNFPRGYGEENDFSMRARAKGLVHICEDSTLVYHKGTASFKEEKQELVLHARRTLGALYPHYKPLIVAWEQDDPLQPFRASLREALERELAQPALPAAPAVARAVKPVLFTLMHNGKGGTLHQVDDLLFELRNEFDCYVLQADLRAWDFYRFGADGKRLEESFTFVNEWTFGAPLDGARQDCLDLLCARIKPDLYHIHHLLALHPDIVAQFKRRGRPVVMSLHDFYLISPTIQLIDHDNRFTAGYYADPNGDPGPCTSRWYRETRPTVADEYRWRTLAATALDAADALVVPSPTTSQLIREHFEFLPEDKFRVFEHGLNMPGARFVENALTAPLRVALFGAVGVSKGILFFEQMLRRNKETGTPIEFHFLGVSAPRLDFAELGCTDHGPYERAMLAEKLAAIAPHVSIIPAMWPETFCYCVSESWAMGVPVLGSTLGAVGERITRHNGGWALPPNDPVLWLDKLNAIAATSEEYERCRQAVRGIELKTVAAMAEKYRRLYGAMLGEGAPAKTARPEVAV